MTTECRSRALSTWATKCQCQPCRDKRARARKQLAAGIYTRVSAEAGLAALDRMIVAGYNGLAVASACNVNGDTARSWVRRRKDGEEIRLGPLACLALVTARPPTQGTVGSLVARRKLRALARLGWGCYELGRLMESAGFWPVNPQSTFGNIRSGYALRIDASLHLAINELYKRLEMQPAPEGGPCTHTRNVAKRNKWAAPLAWDDIDDPEDSPQGRRDMRKWDWTRHGNSVDWTAVERACDGDNKDLLLTHAEREAVVDRMRKAGFADREIERITGIGKAQRYRKPLPETTKVNA